MLCRVDNEWSIEGGTGLLGRQTTLGSGPRLGNRPKLTPGKLDKGSLCTQHTMLPHGPRLSTEMKIAILPIGLF